MTLTDTKLNDRILIWKNALEILKENISPSTFEPWIMPLSPVLSGDENFKQDIFVLKSHQAFGVSHLNQKYLQDIEKAVQEASKTDVSVEIIFVPAENKKYHKKKEAPIKEEQIENLKQMQSLASLNLKYTFENFVEGENSKVAYNAAKMIAKNPGTKFNPLFITGTVGIGKTHLMQAIGHSILKNFPNLKIKYAKTEEFTNQLVESCRKGIDSYELMRKFREQYRNIDVLLLDDIQFAEGKKRTEEEIFNTFDALFHAGKQIVFASDRPIETFKNTPDRLKSRYEWGLSVEIKPPPLDIRIEIIKSYAKRSNYPISDDVAEFLAQNFSKNVRELEGAYNRVSAYASIQGVELTVDTAKEILGKRNTDKKITPEDIIEKTANFYDVTPSSIKGKERTGNIAHARQCAIYLTKDILDLTFPSIAKVFNKNHTTIIYACEKTKKNLQTDIKLKNDLSKIKDLIME